MERRAADPIAGGNPAGCLGAIMISAVTRRPTLVAAMAALLGVSALLVVASAPSANASISWSAVNPPLPANAVSGSGLTIASTSCPVDGWCVGVGNYPALTGTTYYSAGLIVSESGGTWSSAESPLPANAAVDPQAFLQAVTCTGVGSCVAVGRYLDASGATQGLVEQLSNGVWAPSEVTPPSDAVTSGTSAYAQLSAVACPSAGWCTALGLYTQASGAEQAFVDTDLAGTWSAATAPVPAPATGSQFVALACPAIGSCVATGTYLEAGSSLGFADALSGGTWAATALPLPSGTSSMASVANNDLSVSCAVAGSCVVAGTTFDGNYEGLLDTLSGGSWTALAVPTPGGQPSADVQLTSVACTDPNTCVATGFDTVSGVEQGVLESLGSGTWNASVAPTPTGSPPGDVELLNVACPAAGTCVADGQTDVNGAQNGLFWNLSSGAWSVTPAPLPADALVGSDPSFAPIACPGVGVCLAVGTYQGTGGREGVIETDPSLAVSTTTVSAQRVASQTISYSASVVGPAGPTGTVTFSSGLAPLCTATISNGTASCLGPAPQTRVVLGSYSGDGSSDPSWGTGVSPATPSSIVVLSGSGQSTSTNFWFSHTLVVEVTNSSGAGVPGVVVTFWVPTSGPSAVLWGPATAVTNAAGIASSPLLTANNKVGSYTVVAYPNTMFAFALFSMTNHR